MAATGLDGVGRRAQALKYTTATPNYSLLWLKWTLINLYPRRWDVIQPRT